MATLVKLLDKEDGIESRLCVTGQHREMLDQVLSLFDITPDFDLKIMQESQSLTQIVARVMLGVEKVIKTFKPDVILVHGVTATTFAVSMTSFFNRITVGHVEAGLRTGNLQSPWPEEMNKKSYIEVAPDFWTVC
ncbi:MAG: UDP-N-acetylglucosamine 2-epimerase [Pseudomonadales bacterium]